MSKHLSREEVIQNKKSSIRKLNTLLEKYIADDKTLRKADLVSKWLKDYTNYLNFEEKFDPTKNISYKRGNIVKVNFGFNVGSELGGVHYAVVLDNDNKLSCDTITVAPMSSVKPGRKIHPNNLNIGEEFYNTLNARFNSLLSELKTQFDLAKNYVDLLDQLKSIYEAEDSDSSKRIQAEIASQKLRIEANKKLDLINSQIEIATKNRDELELMSSGSVVKLDQIRTISKMRIWIPQNTNDVLYGISLSKPTMEKINEKIKKLYIF